MVARPLRERFNEKVDRSGGPDACWPWTGALTTAGYGSISADGGTPILYAHRVAWELANGRPVPDGMDMRHTCDHTWCVNDAHLTPGTAYENSMDMVHRGRFRGIPPQRGEKNVNAKLNEALVHEIRSSKESATSIARRLGMDTSSICDVRNGLTWRHVLPPVTSAEGTR